MQWLWCLQVDLQCECYPKSHEWDESFLNEIVYDRGKGEEIGGECVEVQWEGQMLQVQI